MENIRLFADGGANIRSEDPTHPMIQILKAQDRNGLQVQSETLYPAKTSLLPSLNHHPRVRCRPKP